MTRKTHTLRGISQFLGVRAVVRGALRLAVLAALILVAVCPSQAQIETVLYNFTGGSDGANPQSRLTSDAAGNFFGTAYTGGLGAGTVFELSPNGGGGWNETVLHSFTGGLNIGPDGAGPLGPVIFDRMGNLYGTTRFGGTDYHYCSYGTEFELSPAGASWTETIVLSQPCSWQVGVGPENGLIMDRAGNLYGTTPERLPVPGTVFELSPSGGGWTAQVIYQTPTSSGLTMDAAGNIYGATSSTVFELSPDGHGGWKPIVLHTFSGAPKDGDFATGTPVLDQAGVLYGTTQIGGTYNHGTVYRMSPGKDGWTEEILYSFPRGKNGATPVAGIVLDAVGNIYGTTELGGSKDRGTVFELATLDNLHYQHTVLWTFAGTDGANPLGSLILDHADHLYGTTTGGGSSNAGVVFQVTGVRVATATALLSSPNPSSYGQAVTFTAKVTSPRGAPPDGGTVTFMKGTTILGAGSLIGGSAGFSTSSLPVGMSSITAVYGGQAFFLGSRSNVVKQTVSKTTTATTLVSAPNPSSHGQTVTFAAIVSSSRGAPPDGSTVTFKKGATVLGAGSLSAGSARLTISALPVGTSWITAVYGGNGTFASSTSSAVKQVVR